MAPIAFPIQIRELRGSQRHLGVIAPVWPGLQAKRRPDTLPTQACGEIQGAQCGGGGGGDDGSTTSPPSLYPRAERPANQRSFQSCSTVTDPDTAWNSSPSETSVITVRSVMVPLMAQFTEPWAVNLLSLCVVSVALTSIKVRRVGVRTFSVETRREPVCRCSRPFRRGPPTCGS